MLISVVMALAAANPAAPPALAPADHAQHQQHAQQQQHAEHQQHMKQCHDMMAKMHQGMHHPGPSQGGAKAGSDHKDHTGH